MKKKCSRCGRKTENRILSSRGECSDCKRRRDESSASSRRMANAGVGDMFGTGLLGGMDMSTTTPF